VILTLVKFETTVTTTEIPVSHADIFVTKSINPVLLENVIMNILPITAVRPHNMPDNTLARSKKALIKICNVTSSFYLASFIP
jgi:hypothetical protein